MMYDSEELLDVARGIVDRTRIMEDGDYDDVLHTAVRLIDVVKSMNAVIGDENTHELMRNVLDVSKSLHYEAPNLA